MYGRSSVAPFTELGDQPSASDNSGLTPIPSFPHSTVMIGLKGTLNVSR